MSSLLFLRRRGAGRDIKSLAWRPWCEVDASDRRAHAGMTEG